MPTVEARPAIAPWTRTAGGPEQVDIATEAGEHVECGQDPEACGFRSGIFSLQLRSGPPVRIEQRVSDLSPTGEYCLVAWIRGTPGAVATLGAGNGKGAVEETTTFQSLKWREVRLRLEAPADGTITVFYGRPESADGSVWLDDVGLAPTPDGFECSTPS